MSWWNAVRDVMNPVQAINDAKKTPGGMTNMLTYGIAPGGAANALHMGFAANQATDGSGVTPVPVNFGALQYMNPMQALQLTPQQAAGQVTPQMLAQQPIQSQQNPQNGWLQLMQQPQQTGLLGGK